MDKVIKVSKPYRPSNGTEGMYFTSEFCEQCFHENPHGIIKEKWVEMNREELVSRLFKPYMVIHYQTSKMDWPVDGLLCGINFEIQSRMC